MISLKQILLESVPTPRTWRPEDLQMLDKLSPAIANQFGESISQVLDAGAFGITYRLASGKIFKITQDAREIAAASKLRTKSKTPHVVSYYDIKQLLNFDRLVSSNIRGRQGGDIIAAIVMDAVKTLTWDEKQLYQAVRQNLIFDSYTTDEVLHKRVDSFVKELDGTVAQHAIDTMNKIIDQRQSIMRDLRQHNIDVGEAHANNVGFDQYGQFVVFDVRHGNRYKAASYHNAVSAGTIKRATKPIDLLQLHNSLYTTDGIDTPGDPTM